MSGAGKASCGYAAYVQGANGSAAGVTVRGLRLTAGTHLSLERSILRDHEGRVVRFPDRASAEAAASEARWNNQTCGAIACSRLRRDEIPEGVRDLPDAQEEARLAHEERQRCAAAHAEAEACRAENDAYWRDVARDVVQS